MLERGSTFLRIELLIVLLATPLFAAGCGPRQVWGYPAQQLQLRLSTQRYAVLASVDFSRQDPAQALTLSPGAPYYLSFVFDSLQMPDQALRMLELAWARCPEPWKREAGVLLGQRYNAGKNWPQAIAVARSLLSTEEPPDIEQGARRVLVEALYWTQDDPEVLRQAALLTSPDPEVLLFRGVSSLRLGLPAGHDLIVRLFLHERVSSLHARFFTYLTSFPQYGESFSDLEKDLIAAKNDLFLQDWDAGIPLMENVLSRIEPDQGGVLVADLAAAYQASGRQAEGARFLMRISSKLAGRARADAFEQAGKLYRRLKYYREAFAAFRAGLAASADADQRDRERWYLLDMTIALHSPAALSQVEATLAATENPAFFSDVLDGWISDLVAARRWSTLAGLWRVVRSRGTADVDARLSYLLARAALSGLVASASLPASPRALLQEAIARDSDGYYGLMAASVVGQAPALTTPASPGGAAVPPAPGSDGAAASPAQPVPALDPFITGFLPFGLSEMAYQRLSESRAGLSDGQLLEAARLMARAGDYASSMHLMGILAARRSLSLPELQMEYPRAFSSVIDGLAAVTGISGSVLYGMVREESFFDPDIVSSVGAVGLSQLMPATAAAVARKLHVENPDLHDPGVNLSIGIRHFQELLRSVGSVPKALLSYNAGLARVRAWERKAGGMPGDLFVEAVPFEETRGYVRKILVSTVMYASLYDNEDPRQAALSFFDIKGMPPVN